MTLLLPPSAGSLLTTDPAVRVERIGPDRWSDGAEIVRAAREATGLPASVPLERMVDHIGGRQHRALGVWLASVRTASGVLPAGHALCTLVDPEDESWTPIEDPTVRLAHATGRLVALGGLAVHPGFTGRGVAGALVRTRLAWLREHGFVPCSRVWDASPASRHLAERYGRRVGHHPTEPLTLFVY